MLHVSRTCSATCLFSGDTFRNGSRVGNPVVVVCFHGFRVAGPFGFVSQLFPVSSAVCISRLCVVLAVLVLS